MSPRWLSASGVRYPRSQLPMLPNESKLKNDSSAAVLVWLVFGTSGVGPGGGDALGLRLLRAGLAGFRCVGLSANLQVFSASTEVAGD